MSPSEVRAEVMRQFHERGYEDMAELLILLEEKEWAREAMIVELNPDNIKGNVRFGTFEVEE